MTRTFFISGAVLGNAWPIPDPVMNDLQHLPPFHTRQWQPWRAHPLGAEPAFLDGELDVLDELGVGVEVEERREPAVDLAGAIPVAAQGKAQGPAAFAAAQKKGPKAPRLTPGGKPFHIKMDDELNKKADGIGGHLSTFASSAALYDVGFNHFFRGKDDGGSGDHIYFQGHAAPGIYARAFLERRLGEDDLDRFRREIGRGTRGLSSYPHPRLMPDFWEFPTVSMGLGPLTALYQARFNRYLHQRGLAEASARAAMAEAPADFEEFRPYLLRYALMQLRDSDAAQDVVQETLLAALQGARQFEQRSAVRTWLIGILKHKITDHLRRRGIRDHVDIDEMSNSLELSVQAGSASAVDARRMLDSLPERQRTIVSEISIEGRSAADVASHLGMSEGAVRVALHRALKSLAALYRRDRS